MRAQDSLSRNLAEGLGRGSLVPAGQVLFPTSENWLTERLCLLQAASGETSISQLSLRDFSVALVWKLAAT